MSSPTPQTPRAAPPVWGEGQPRVEWPGRGQPPRVPAAGASAGLCLRPHPTWRCSCPRDAAAAAPQPTGSGGEGGNRLQNTGSFELRAKPLPRGSLGVKQAWPPRVVPCPVPPDTSKLRDGSGACGKDRQWEAPASSVTLPVSEPSPPLILGNKPNSHSSEGQTAPFVSFAKWKFVPVFPGRSALAVQEVWGRAWLQFGKMLC